MNSVDQMKLFMEPRSVAIIGASRATGPGSLNILQHLVNARFAGRLYPVNPNARKILRMKCYPSVLDVPDNIDLAVISTPRSLVPQLVEECTRRAIRAITVVAQGLADGDEEGKELQSEIVRIAREGGSRILGPNTFGTVNAFNNLTTAFLELEMKKVPIGIIAQTGLFFVGLPMCSLLGKGIDLGNACDIEFADGLEYFEHDPDIRVILLHVEGIREGRRFMEVARRVAKRKPILALKTGKGDEGARATQSHTGSLAGKDEVYDAAFKQCGVIRVNDVDEYEDVAKAFLRLPLMKGRGIGVITLTGAGGIITLDACEKYNLCLAKLSPDTLSKLGALAPPWQSLGNPADIWAPMMIAGHPFDEVFSTTLAAFLADPNVHGLIIIFYAFSPEVPISLMGGVLKVIDRFEKPVVCWLYGPKVEQLASMMDKTGNIVVYPTLDRAVRALSRLNDYFQIIEGDR